MVRKIFIPLSRELRSKARSRLKTRTPGTECGVVHRVVQRFVKQRVIHDGGVVVQPDQIGGWKTLYAGSCNTLRAQLGLT